MGSSPGAGARIDLFCCRERALDPDPPVSEQLKEPRKRLLWSTAAATLVNIGDTGASTTSAS